MNLFVYKESQQAITNRILTKRNIATENQKNEKFQYFFLLCQNLYSLDLNAKAYIEKFNAFLDNVESNYFGIDIDISICFNSIISFLDDNFSFYKNNVEMLKVVLKFINNILFTCNNFSIYIMKTEIFKEISKLLYIDKNIEVANIYLLDNIEIFIIEMEIIKNIILDLNEELIHKYFQKVDLCSLINIVNKILTTCDNKILIKTFLSIINIAAFYTLIPNNDKIIILHFVNQYISNMEYLNDCLEISLSLLINYNVKEGYNFLIIDRILSDSVYSKLRNNDILISALKFLTSCYRHNIFLFNVNINQLLQISLFPFHDSNLNTSIDDHRCLISFYSANAIRRLLEKNTLLCSSLQINDLLHIFLLIPNNIKEIFSFVIITFFENTSSEAISFYIDFDPSIFQIIHCILEIEVEVLVKACIALLNNIFARSSIYDPMILQKCLDKFHKEFSNDTLLELFNFENEELNNLARTFFENWHIIS